VYFSSEVLKGKRRALNRQSEKTEMGVKEMVSVDVQ
jgi:hypothetical protein